MLEPVDEDIYENDELKHFGIIGMKWGIRRFQNPDGTLTPEGKLRYSKSGKGYEDYLNDNWKRATKQAEDQMKSDKKYKKFVDDPNYREFRDPDDQKAFSKYFNPDIYPDDTDDYYVDYYTILGAKTQEILDKEYKEVYKNIYLDSINDQYDRFRKRDDAKSDKEKKDLIKQINKGEEDFSALLKNNTKLINQTDKVNADYKEKINKLDKDYSSAVKFFNDDDDRVGWYIIGGADMSFNEFRKDIKALIKDSTLSERYKIDDDFIRDLHKYLVQKEKLNIDYTNNLAILSEKFTKEIGIYDKDEDEYVSQFIFSRLERMY